MNSPTQTQSFQPPSCVGLQSPSLVLLFSTVMFPLLSSTTQVQSPSPATSRQAAGSCDSLKFTVICLSHSSLHSQQTSNSPPLSSQLDFPSALFSDSEIVPSSSVHLAPPHSFLEVMSMHSGHPLRG